jgi:hypothetical protein
LLPLRITLLIPAERALADCKAIEPTFNLHADDLNALKATDGLADSNETSFIQAEAGAVEDMAGQKLKFVDGDGGAIKVTSFVPDSKPPSLVSFETDLNSGKLHLTFSESIKASTMNVGSIALQSAKALSAGIKRVILKGSNVAHSSPLSVTILLDSDIINEIKSARTFGTNENNTFVTITSAAIKDTSNNDVVTILNSDGVQAFAVKPDETKPEVRDFALDMNNGIMNITFSEAMDPNTVVSASFILQDKDNSPSNTKSGKML